jgi:hypothetical protein
MATATDLLLAVWWSILQMVSMAYVSIVGNGDAIVSCEAQSSNAKDGGRAQKYLLNDLLIPSNWFESTPITAANSRARERQQ